jgi:hypothetical protein
MKCTVRNRLYYCTQKAYKETGSLVGVIATDTIIKSDFLTVLHCVKRGSTNVSGC